MRTTLLAVVAVGVVAVGCTHQPAAVPAAPAEPSTSRLQAPLSASWEQRSLTSGGASLVAHVKRIAPMNMKVLVRIEVPAGAKLTTGRPQFVLPENAEASEVTEPVELTFDPVPAGDLMLRVDSESQEAGFHFFTAYRFGRAAPALPTAVQPEGPPVKKGDRNLGSSVPIQ